MPLWPFLRFSAVILAVDSTRLKIDVIAALRLYRVRRVFRDVSYARDRRSRDGKREQTSRNPVISTRSRRQLLAGKKISITKHGGRVKFPFTLEYVWLTYMCVAYFSRQLRDGINCVGILF